MKRTQVEVCCRCSIELLGVLEAEKDYCGKEHFHSFFEIFYIAEGEFSVSLPENVYFLKKGELFIISPTVHHIFSSKTGGKMIYLGSGYFNHWKDTHHPCFVDSALKGLSAYPPLYEILEKLPKEEDLSQISTSLLGIVAGLLDEILEENSFSKGEVLCEKVKNHIHSHISDKLTVSSIADAMYTDAGYLGALFKKSCGFSIKEYIIKQKMEKAFSLLKRNTMSVSEISESLGFDTVQYFSTKFREYYGISPQKYKNKLKEKTE